MSAVNLSAAILTVVLLVAGSASAQIDTEFWFVAPSVTEQHGDAPVVFRFTALEEDAQVSIVQPANTQWITISFTVPAGQTRSIDVTSRLDLLESKPAFRPQNKGVFIQSSRPITAYYEVNNQFNPDIFALKGRNALGKEFFIPAQNYWPNAGGFDPPARSAFDIVATADDTHIFITPSVNVVGHQGGTTFEIVLQNGQTYSVEASGPDQNQQLTGSKVSADQQIAISLKHDSNQFDPCYDLGGDQLVPVDVLGTEYIVVRGFLEGGDRVFVLATQDNTSIQIEGANGLNSTESAQINAGQSYQFVLGTPMAHIESTAPIYVLHATGFGCEVGLALLPKLRCTGSSTVSFTRSTDEGFGLILITKNGNQDAFNITPEHSISPDLFDTVPGTEGIYVAAQINLSDPPRANQAYQVSNSKGVFHLGTINGGERSGTRYGYFSDFKTLKVLADASKICLGAMLELSASGSDIYEWFGDEAVDGMTSQKVSISPDTTTTFGVIGSDGANACLDTAYLEVEVFEWAQPMLSVSPTCTDIEVSLTYTGIEPLQQLTWIFGLDTFITHWMDTLQLVWKEPGLQRLDLQALNPAGCLTDTSFFLDIGGVMVQIDTINSLTRGEEIMLTTVVLDGSVAGANIMWSPDVGLSCVDCLNPIFKPDVTTDYILTITDTLGCVSQYDTRIYVESPIFIPNAFSPNDDNINDVFEVFADGIGLDEMLISNRWGQIIYQVKANPDLQSGEISWDGRINGEVVEAGVYVYYIKGRHLVNNSHFEKSGSVTVIR